MCVCISMCACMCKPIYYIHIFVFLDFTTDTEMLTGRVVVMMVVVVQVSQRGPAATVVFQVEGLVMGLGVAGLPLPLAVSVGGGAEFSVLTSPGLVLVFWVVFLVLLP